MRYVFCLLLLFSGAVQARTLETCYGPLEIKEQVLWDLIDSPAVQRLKEVRQYGVCYYAGDREHYDRYQHSVGVLALLRINGAPLKEQIAGLLHDASHTAFSHLGDYFFDHVSHKDSYQDTIHVWHLKQSGLDAILQKHGLSAEIVCHKKGDFAALERDLPDLCADRLDYNLQGALRRGWISVEEVKEMAKAFKYEDGYWVCSDASVARLISDYSLYMTEHCWGAPGNTLCNNWLSEALVRACQKELISLNDVHFGKDEEIWQKLKQSKDTYILERLDWIAHWKDHFVARPFVSEGEAYTAKFRGIDPLVEQEGKHVRLTELDAEYAADFQRLAKRMRSGWAVTVVAH